MFTGLVRAIGQLRRCPGGVMVHDRSGNAHRAGSVTRPVAGVTAGLAELAPLAIGDSVAVDGVCLTLAELIDAGSGFRADASEETLRRTTLAAKADRGGLVNLEPALRLSDRLGGHLVSGHVDGTGTVRAIGREPASWRLELGWNDPTYGRYVCEKASITVDGISLTVAGCSSDGHCFWVAVIPHTWAVTTLAGLQVGDAVNLEADLLAKYTERLLHAEGTQPQQQISSAWLAEQGWLPG